MHTYFVKVKIFLNINACLQFESNQTNYSLKNKKKS